MPGGNHIMPSKKKKIRGFDQSSGDLLPATAGKIPVDHASRYDTHKKK
jgi:hypothetical protein